MNKIAVFTMDVEAFYHCECLKGTDNNCDLIMNDGISSYLNLLNKYNIKADLFLVSSLNELIKEDIKKAIIDGHQINIHGFDHTSPLFYSKEEFKENINKAIINIKETFNINPIGYRAPCFYIDNSKLEIVKEVGLLYDSSFINSRFLYYENKLNMNEFNKICTNIYKKDNFFEFGLPTYKNIPIGGGGYSRLVPSYRYFHFLKKYIKKNDFFVFYVHPFELSSVKIPHLKNINLFDKLYLKIGRKKYLHKIEKIINILKANGFDFKTFEQIIKK